MTRGGAAVTEIAGYADEYQTNVFDELLGEFDVNRDELLDADPITSLEFYFRLYGFNRRGRPRETYASNANAALDAAATGQRIDPDELWLGFEAECRRTSVGVNPSHTRGVVEGTARLVNREGNLFQWVGREVDDHGRLSVLYDELTSLGGVEPAIAKFFLRDAVWISDVEYGVRNPDERFLQSMTRWVTAVTESLWPTLDGANDDVLAKRIVDACREAGVSGVEFNQGAWYFGREVVGDPSAIESRVDALGENDW